MSDPKSNAWSRRRIAIIVSLGVHLLLAIGLLCWYIPNQTEDSQSVAAATAPTDTPSGKPAPPEPEENIEPSQIADAVSDKIEAVSKIPDDRKLSQLDSNLKRLESIATEESVAEVTTTIADSIGLDTQAYAEKETVSEGPFDAETAQLDDVIRSQDAKGNWSYQTVLVDAGGRKMTVPMTVAEGESLYKTFETMKRFPMARGIYRSVVMPMIQKMLDTSQSNPSPNRPATVGTSRQ